MNELLSDAQRVAKGATRPTYTRREYEGAMLDLAAREVRGTETPAAAFARLCSAGDERMDVLHKAATAASVPPAEGRFARYGGVKGLVSELMAQSTRARKRENETDEQAMARLLEEDPVLRDAYDFYSEQK